MNLRKNILSALLLALGFILHQIIPGTVGGMKFDIQLAVLFVVISVNMDFKNTIATSLTSGILTAMTTTFPGGHIPNIIDKVVTGITVYFLLAVLARFLNKQLTIAMTGFIGTVISGTVFLTSAKVIVGLPPSLSFFALFLGIVLPTALTNIFLTNVIYNLVNTSQKRLSSVVK